MSFYFNLSILLMASFIGYLFGIFFFSNYLILSSLAGCLVALMVRIFVGSSQEWGTQVSELGEYNQSIF